MSSIPISSASPLLGSMDEQMYVVSPPQLTSHCRSCHRLGMSAFSILAPCLLLTRQGTAGDGQADICTFAHWPSHSFIQRKKGNSLKLQVMLQLTIFFLVYNFLSCLQFFTKTALMESSMSWIGMGPSLCCTFHTSEPSPGGRKMILSVRHGKSARIS